jgi:circadian clock protein KaiB
MWVGDVERDRIRPSGEQAMRLRLYIAESTPNSVRAVHNLSVLLNGLEGSALAPELEIIDVFTQPRRAIIEGVIVTPTLIGMNGDKRIVLIGDLSDQSQVRRALGDFLGLSL